MDFIKGFAVCLICLFALGFAFKLGRNSIAAEAPAGCSCAQKWEAQEKKNAEVSRHLREDGHDIMGRAGSAK